MPPRLAPPIKWNQTFSDERREKKNRHGYCLFIARVCPAVGEPDLKTSPPVKWKHRDLSERHEQTGSGANSLLAATKKGKGNQ
jgi:hypothetical protein